jgi:hypothetical protein
VCDCFTPFCIVSFEGAKTADCACDQFKITSCHCEILLRVFEHVKDKSLMIRQMIENKRQAFKVTFGRLREGQNIARFVSMEEKVLEPGRE